MKRLTLSLLVIFLASPLFVVAQDTAASRYCPNPETDFFKGSIYYEGNQPWIEIRVDPAFEAKMVKERNLTAPLPLTPVYDLVVRIKPEFNYYCIPGWVEGQEVTAEKLLFSLPISAELVVGQNSTFILDTTHFLRTGQQDEQNRFVYEWKIKGWPWGITSAAKINLLIDAAKKSEPINILLSVPQSDGSTKKILSPVSFSTCAPLWGGGEHRITFMRGDSSFLYARSVPDFFVASKEYEERGFAVIEPLKTYENYFTFLVDLALYEDSELLAHIASKKFNAFTNKPLAIIFSQSACTPVGIGIFHTGKVTMGYNGSQPQAFATIDRTGKKVGMKYVVVSEVASPEVIVHEFGHAFADLGDEADYRNAGVYTKAAFSPNWLGRNCSVNPSQDFSFGGKRYGAENIQGCGFSRVRTKVSSLGLEYASVFRSSQKSIMNYAPNNEPNFNVASCGPLIASILKYGDAKSYFPECAKMDGVIKDGVQASALYPLFAAVERIFNQSSVGVQIAAIGDSTSSATGQYLIVESFDPNNPWGEIIEVVPDSQTITSPLAPTTQPPASPAENLGVNSESIFDTISVDLKVNGKDGPVTVSPGSRIVVSWLSEGATRCRANWSRNDIKLAGTAAGRLSRSVTIRAACINAEGERADDAVQVIVDTESS